MTGVGAAFAAATKRASLRLLCGSSASWERSLRPRTSPSICHGRPDQQPDTCLLRALAHSSTSARSAGDNRRSVVGPRPTHCATVCYESVADASQRILLSRRDRGNPGCTSLQAFTVTRGSSRESGRRAGCGANAGDRRKKALGSLTRITRQALHSKSQARFCF